MAGNWLGQSLISMLCLIPAWLAIGFFDRNYQVKPDIFLVWYFLGTAVTSAYFGGPNLDTVVPSWKIVVAILLIGLTIGAASNILLYRAVAEAPNPGLPVAIANAASIGVLFASALLFRVAPGYFGAVKIDLWTIAGVVLVVLGTAVIVVRR